MGLTLDSGALIALEKRDRRVEDLLAEVLLRGERLAVPCGVLAQVWRGGPRRARIAKIVADRKTELVPLSPSVAKAIGVMCARSGVADVVDVSVVLCARQRGDRVLTSDVGDLRRIDPRLPVIAV